MSKDMFCFHCRCREVGNFCRKCGRRLMDLAVLGELQCEGCGKVVPPWDLHCANCGKALAEDMIIYQMEERKEFATTH